MNLNRKWALASVVALAAAAGVVAVGCGDDSTGTTAKDSGAKDGGGTIDGSNFDTPDGTVFDTDSGVTTLYERLGKRDGIAKAVKDVVEGTMGEAADPQILSYFAIRTGHTGATPTAGNPNLGVVEDCFTQFVAKAAGGPELYPYTSTAAGANGFVCRDMATTHTGLGISSAAFQKFVSIAAAKLAAAGVSQADLQTLGGALLGTASDIVDKARVAQQAEAGTDANFNYGARCTDIWDGGGADALAPTAAGCQQN